MASSARKKRRNAVQLAADGFAAMVRSLGMADAVRYVQLYTQGTGDYTLERHAWLDQLDHEHVANLMGTIEKPSQRNRPRRKGQKAGR